jgi:hypothetical protein
MNPRIADVPDGAFAYSGIAEAAPLLDATGIDERP